MQPLSQVRDITNSAEGKLISASEREALAQLDTAVTDTETTGLDRNRNGLTEIASTRAMRDAHGTPRLMLFHRFIMPLRPEYRDYLAACEWAKAEGKPLPPYDRARYEYAIEPQALAITGTEILREKGLDGPITGLKVNGKRVKAEPFYTVMEEFLAFTRNGERDAYFNAPFDAPLIGQQIADVKAHDLARNEAYHDESISQHKALTPEQKRIIFELSDDPYDTLSTNEQAQLVRMMRQFADVPECYSNPARWQCFMYGYMAAHGLGAENTLKAISKKLFPNSEEQADKHSGVQDIMLAAKVGLTLPAASHDKPHVANMRELYEQMLHSVDASGTVNEGPARTHTNGKPNAPLVHGDMIIQFSAAPETLGPKATAYWKFLMAYDEVTRANSRVPQHILSIDHQHHRVTINAERSHSLMLNFMKKQAFFFQMLEHPLFQSVLPYDSTGTVMDVTLRPRGDEPAPCIEAVNYRSLRANIDFLTAHRNGALAYLTLLKRLHKEDARVGLVLFKPQADGALDILVRGHARAFGDCVLHLPAGVPLAEATPQLCRELAMQLKLGAIPNIAEFKHPQDDSETHGDAISDTVDEVNSIEADSLESVAALRTRKLVSHDADALAHDAMQLTLTPEIFQLLAHRLNITPEQMLMDGIRTSHGALKVTVNVSTGQHPHYSITGNTEAFHDFVTLDDSGLKGEKPDNIIRDACWLLYRLQRLPGTSRLRIDGNMAILEQDDGVDTEALGLLHKLGIPFKAYDKHIKVDVHQLMKNAFTWSQGLGRAQQARMKEIKDGKSDALAPARFLLDVRDALWQGNALALEANERGDCWLLDHSGSAEKSPEHHLLEQHAGGVRLTFKRKRLVVEHSDIQGPQHLSIEPRNDGSAFVNANPLLLHLAATQLRRQGVDTEQFSTASASQWHVPAAQLKKADTALCEASRFIYHLSKSTGSERQAIQAMHLEKPNEHVELVLPVREFLNRPGLYRELMALHEELAQSAVDGKIRELQAKLPDPREADPRRDDVQHMAHITRMQQPTLETLAASLSAYLKLLGGAEYAQDASLNLSRELKAELATLGLLLHEVSHRENALAKQYAASEIRSDIHTAQEKISNVAFGGDQLREALAVARKAIVGDAQGNGGLLYEVGAAMAATMDEVAAHAYAKNHATNLNKALADYRAQTIALLGPNGEAAYQQAAYLAAMRYLVRGARDQEHHPIEWKVADYLLGNAYPTMTAQQREAITHLYITGRHDQVVESLHVSFKKPLKRSDFLLTAHQKKALKLDSDYFVRQYELLVERHATIPDITTWLTQNTAVSATIDDDIRKAYRTSGKQYLAMAAICSLESGHAHEGPEGEYHVRAVRCLMRAGWSEEAISAEAARITKRHYSAEQKQHVRNQIAAKETITSNKLEDVLANIDGEGNEAKARAMLSNKYYARYAKEATHMVEGVDDTYYVLKARKALLADIENTLKETHDLLMVKYHHVRDIQGLLVLLSQNESMLASLHDDDHLRIQEIGEQIAHKPEMVGIHDQTLAQVHSAFDEDTAHVYSHLMHMLADHHVQSTLTKSSDNMVVHVALKDLDQMFARWQQYEEGKKPPRSTKMISPHLHGWLARVAGQLFLQADMVQSVQSINTQDAAITCSMTLSSDLEIRQNQWQQLRKAVYGLGVAMPPMPLDRAEQHTLRLPIYSRTQRREERLGNTGEALQTFAESHGMTPHAARSMVERSRANAREPRALARALARAGDKANAVREALDR